MIYMNKTIIYTDGSSRGNPGPGGWGAIIIYLNTVIEIGGRDNNTTNNRMELMGAIEALRKIDLLNHSNSEYSIILNSDSQYVIKGMTEWIDGWIKKDWKNSQKKAVLNRDLWEELIKVSENKNIKWNYVAGHSSIPGNERCDIIATQFADGENVDLYNGPKDKYPFTDILK